MPSLDGTSVLVAGAGMAGLAAAHALEARGASVTVVEARDRVGGRVWTIRDGFANRQHAEAGGDLIDGDHAAVLTLARELRLKTASILSDGFGYYGPDSRGRLAIQPMGRLFGEMPPEFWSFVRDYKLAERRWDSPIARRLAPQSVAGWLRASRAHDDVVERFRGLRGLMLADPEDLSLLAMVDLFADFTGAGGLNAVRLRGGNDRLATGLAAQLRRPVRLNTVVRRLRHTGDGVTVTVEARGALSELRADFVVSALPATTLRDVAIEPAPPDLQQRAIARLRYGNVTRLLLQFDRRFWAKRGRPRAFGSDQSFGALWDGNEQQKGRGGILSFLAGGRASDELQQIVSAGGPDGVARRLRWLGAPGPVVASRSIVWEDDVWARGGYAYFDPGFDPAWREWLARPHGRLVFAGEHTSIRWQGYINGAVESGQRAAGDVEALVSTHQPTR